MWCAVLCVAGCVLLATQAQWIHEPATEMLENEECSKEGDQVWLCKNVTACPGIKGLLQKGRNPRICSWSASSLPIVCCPPPFSSEPLKTSITEKKCSEYQSLLCLNQMYRGPPPPTPKPGTTALFSIGGTLANPAEFPHMALIGYGDEGAISWQCGGSLISERFILSAAHCSSTAYGPARWARLGDLDIKSDTEEARPQQFRIVDRIVHDAYKAPAYYNDIVLFRLDRAVVYDKYVGPACLHTDPADPAGYGIATGWGRNESHGPRPSSLVKVDLKFVPTEECKQKVGTLPGYLSTGLDSRTMLCAGEPGKDTCRGDSGGPLVLADKGGQCLPRQVGVTSFGPQNCGRTPVTGAYVRVAHFVPWIESVVWPESNLAG